MDEVTKAYIAGIIDGEGCVGIHTSRIGRRRRIAYHLRIAVSMTNQEVIGFLQESLGGSFYRHTKVRENRKGSWTWQVHGQKAYTVLKLLLPYLRVKKVHALLGIEFRDNWHDQRRQVGWKGGQPHTTREELERRQGYYQKMKELNC